MKYNLIFLLILVFGSSCEFNIGNSGKLFTRISPSKSNITFTNWVEATEAWNIARYLYFYDGAGVAIGDINNDGLSDIFFVANRLANQLYLNKGNFEFEDISEQSGISGNSGSTTWKTAVSMADVNGDGWLDIYVCQLGKYKGIEGRNELYINNKDGSFSEQAVEYGLDFKGFSQQAAFFDYDMDGDLDVFLVNHSVHSPKSYGITNFRTVKDPLAGDRLYRNDGDKFIEVSAEAGIYVGSMGYGLDVLISDFDQNGCPDIYVTNDFHENDYLYYNQCDGTFIEGIESSMGHNSISTMGCDAADMNNDGLIDLMTLDMKPEDEVLLKRQGGVENFKVYDAKLDYGYHFQFPHNCFQVNMGNLFGDGVQFSEIAHILNLDATDWSWSVLIADYDLDGWKDIFITNGIDQRPNDLDYQTFFANKTVQLNATSMELTANMPGGKVANYAFKNMGDLTFVNVSKDWGLDWEACSNGSAYGDLDNDGDLDLVVNNFNEVATLLRNNANNQNENHWLKIKLEGADKNTSGIGARVQVLLGDTMLTQEQSPLRGWQSTVDPILIFGLGSSSNIDEIRVRWPGGHIQVLENVEANQFITLKEKSNLRKDRPVKEIPENSRMVDVTNISGISVQHQENLYVDYFKEPLIPHKISSEGPGLAVGDINSDGLDDFYFCGAKGYPGSIFIQTGLDSPLFKKHQIMDSLFDEDRLYEDVDALFLDVDNDGDFDLYVVSGGGEVSASTALLKDRLYMNDGRGNFTKNAEAIPDFFENGSCVVSADFNADGTPDLFVGSRSVPGSYGLTPTSYILLNDGNGSFRDAAKTYENELFLSGMVTDACWDASDSQLIVVGEWMPITMYKFDASGVKKRELPNSGGWWNCITTADADGDGDLDLFVGNLGENTPLEASIEEPMGLYLYDFDGDYRVDPVMTYYRQGKNWTLYGKMELSSQIKSIDDVFTDYTSFATLTFEDLFDNTKVKNAEYKKVSTLASVYIENQGDGEYKIKKLPFNAQLSAIQSFLCSDLDQDQTLDVLVVGNFYDFNPIIGRTDAFYGLYYKGIGNGQWEEVAHTKSKFIVHGDVRDLKLLKSNDHSPLVIAAKNNAALQVFKYIN